MKVDVLVVGAGFAGSVAAAQFAAAGYSVLVVDKREHIGGNAYDTLDPQGVLVHSYGPHIFHTNSQRIVDFLSRFTAWRPYEHRVLAELDTGLFPIPINRTTINRLYGLDLNEAGVEEFLSRVREVRQQLRTSEDVVLARVGRDLCDKFFRGYTRKQWNVDLADLDASVAGRVPVRCNDDDRYFTDSFQQMPAEGYSTLFANMLQHPLIRVELGVDFEQVRERIQRWKTVFTGSIDSYFNHVHGRLPYRSLRFEHHHLPGVDRYQQVGTINYPNRHAFTRITEFKHLTGQLHSGTSIVREYPRGEGDPYYPIPNPANAALYAKYSAMAEVERDTIFVGRLAQYRYLNMDQVVGTALKASQAFVREQDLAVTTLASN